MKVIHQNLNYKLITYFNKQFSKNINLDYRT